MRNEAVVRLNPSYDLPSCYPMRDDHLGWELPPYRHNQVIIIQGLPQREQISYHRKEMSQVAYGCIL